MLHADTFIVTVVTHLSSEPWTMTSLIWTIREARYFQSVIVIMFTFQFHNVHILPDNNSLIVFALKNKAAIQMELLFVMTRCEQVSYFNMNLF